MDQDWLQHLARVFHIDFHTPAQVRIAEEYDVDAFGDALVAMHTQAVVLFAKCHYGLSYYDTRVGTRHPGLDFDLLGAQIEACRRRDIRVLVYYSVARDSLAYDSCPDWRQRNPQGEGIRLQKGDWGTVCFNSPYSDEVVWPQLREVISNYHPDGIWWDIVEWSPGACYCPYCLEQMELAGVDPNNATEHHEFNEWALQHFLERAKVVGKEIEPGLVYAVNATGGVGRARASARHVDQILTESIPYRHGFLYWMPFGHHMRTLGRPFNACMSHWHKAWDDYGGLKTDAQMQYETGHALSVGASCLFVDQPMPDVKIWPTTVEQIGRTFRWLAERETWSLPAEPLAEVAVLADRTTGTAAYARHWNGVQGACKALSESHFLFDVIDDEADFDRYPALILPDNRCLDAGTCDKLRQYVQNGGALLATHCASLLPAHGREGSEFSLSDLFGVSFRGLSPYTRGYFKILEEAGLEGLPDQPWIVYDRVLNIATCVETEVLATLANPIFEVTDGRSYSHAQAPPSDNSPPWIASVTHHRYGAGNVIYVSAPIFRTYWEHNVPQYRTLMAGLLNRMLKDQHLVQVIAGPSVDVSLMKQDNRLVLHLLNYHAERRADLPLSVDESDPLNRWGPTRYPRPDLSYDRLPAREVIEEVPPRFNIAVQVRAPALPGQIYLAPHREELDFTFEKGDGSEGVVHFVVPELRIHQMVVLDFTR